MEQFLNVIHDLEVMDCGESGGVSTNMERDAIICLLEHLRHQINIGEITTNI